jgi:mono/diheme cytochrome c family protein
MLRISRQLAPLICCAAAVLWSRPTAAAESSPEAATQQTLAFVQKHCIACHGEQDFKADLSLAPFKDLPTIAQGRDAWERVTAMVEAGEMPPKDKPQPTADETTAFLANVQALFDHVDRTAPRDPGRVTIRRLNRAEYNNTIRDLVGVDFLPAEDFPSDDVGHGFDNIGDVLTLSPVLMERYLAAAESIMQRAIAVDPPAPPVRALSAKYLEPAGPDVPQSRYRPISLKPDAKPIFSGPLHTRYENLPAGDYSIRVRCYATTEGSEPVRIAVMAAGPELVGESPAEEVEKIPLAKNLGKVKFLQMIEVPGRDEKTAQNFDVPFALPVGFERIAVGLLATSAGQPLPTLHVEYFALTGPMDTRPATHRKLLACSQDKSQAEQTREVLSRFATRAYRRPATDDEVERLCKFVEQEVADGQKWESAVQLAMQAVLCSPKFLFRVELDDRPDSPEPHPISEYQLASRLSYFLWATMPDQELFDLAAKGELTKNLESQVRRMLSDTKAESLFDQFALQWLQLGRINQFAPDKEQFPLFNDDLRRDMLAETKQFFLSVVKEDRSILDFIDADYTYMNARLADFYHVSDTVGNPRGQPVVRPGGTPIQGEELVRVSLPDKSRGGLLTMASVLTVTSNPTRTSPVKRGRWVLEQMLGTPPPPPPPNVPELPEDKNAQLTGSLRQRLEQHRANPACANCHAKMDPLGFAFENFDAIGRFREKDGEFAIDPSGTLPGGQTFSGPAELKVIVVREKRELFARCLTEKLLTYALGRGLEHYDRPAVKKMTTALAADDYRFSRLVLEIVNSDQFRMRRGKEPTP